MSDDRDEPVPYASPAPKRARETHYAMTGVIASAVGLAPILLYAVLMVLHVPLALSATALWVLLIIFFALGIYGGLMGFYAILAGLFEPDHRRQIVFGIFALLMAFAQ